MSDKPDVSRVEARAGVEPTYTDLQFCTGQMDANSTPCSPHESSIHCGSIQPIESTGNTELGRIPHTSYPQRRFRKKPVVVEATQWFKNGDHPLDYSKDHDGFEGGELRVFTAAERKAGGWEGDVVRYFRRPDVPGFGKCGKCGLDMHGHGWIDTLEGGHIVCPGDWIITGVAGEMYPCKPAIFEATYEAAE